MAYTAKIFNNMVQPQGQVTTQPVRPPVSQPTQPAPTQPTAPNGAPLRDLFKWLGNTRNVADNPWARGMVANDDARNTGGNENWEFVRTGGGESGVYDESWRVRPGSQLDKFNQQYGLNTQVNKENDQYQHNFDASKLPTTRFGGFNDIIPVDDQTRLINRNLVIDDPHYGKITSRANMARPNAWVGPLLMTIASMGAGSLVGAGAGASAANTFRTATSGLRALQSMMNGGSPYGFLLNLALQQAGVPSLGRVGANMAFSQLLNNRRGRGG